MGSSTVRTITSLGVTYYSDEPKVRRFDKESTLDPDLKPILKHTYIPSPRTIAEPFKNALPGPSTKADAGESGEHTADPVQQRIEELEKELAELKVAKGELEHKYQSEKGMRRGAETKISWLQMDLKESRDLVTQLEKQSTKSV